MTIEKQKQVFEEMLKLYPNCYDWDTFKKYLRLFYPRKKGGVAFLEFPTMPGVFTINVFSPGCGPGYDEREVMLSECKNIGCKKVMSKYSCKYVDNLLRSHNFIDSDSLPGWLERVL